MANTYELTPRDEEQLRTAVLQRGTTMVTLECNAIVHVTTWHRATESEVTVEVIIDRTPVRIFNDRTSALNLACLAVASAVEQFVDQRLHGLCA